MVKQKQHQKWKARKGITCQKWSHMFPEVTARSSFYAFWAKAKRWCSFREHLRKVAFINDKSDNFTRILWNHRYWPHQRWAKLARAAKRNDCWSAPCSSHFHTFITNPCRMWRQWRIPTVISLGLSSRIRSSLMGPISTVQDYSCEIIRFVINKCHLAQMLSEATPTLGLSPKCMKWRPCCNFRKHVRPLLACNSFPGFSFLVLLLLHDIGKVVRLPFFINSRILE